MKAGRELDAMVAEKVFGQPRPKGSPYEYRYTPWVGYVTPGSGPGWKPKPYSTDISAAWEVVEKMRGGGWLPVVKHMPDEHPFVAQGSASEYAPSPDQSIRGTEGGALAEFYPVADELRDLRGFDFNATTAETVPLAICLAALKAVED